MTGIDSVTKLLESEVYGNGLTQWGCGRPQRSGADGGPSGAALPIAQPPGSVEHEVGRPMTPVTGRTAFAALRAALLNRMVEASDRVAVGSGDGTRFDGHGVKKGDGQGAIR